jgi:hypothetical protein
MVLAFGHPPTLKHKQQVMERKRALWYVSRKLTLELNGKANQK